MSKLQLRRHQRLRRQERLTLLRRASLPALAAALLYLLLQLPATRAFFTSRAEVPPAVFRATAFADNLALAPGNSKTNDSPGDPGPAFFVAQSVSGQIYLDFGTYPTGNNRNFPSVLVVTNIGGRLLTLNRRFSANLAPFFEQEEPVSIAPGEKATLGFKLDTRPGDQPGEYLGTLYLSGLDGFITAELPARLRLAAPSGGNKKMKGQEGSVSDKVYDTVYENLKLGGSGSEAEKMEQQVTEDAASTDEAAAGDNGGSAVGPPAVQDVDKEKENKSKEQENAGPGPNNKGDDADGKTPETDNLNEQVQPKQDDTGNKTQINSGVSPADKVDAGGNSNGNSTNSGS